MLYNRGSHCPRTMEKGHVVSLRNEVESLLKGLKREIGDDYRASEDDTLPGMLVTIGAEPKEDGISWGYQTGDNSYTGGAYGFQHWTLIYLYRRSNCRDLAKDAVEELLEEFASSGLEVV